MVRSFDNPNNPPASDTKEIEHQPIVEEIFSDADLKSFYRQRETNTQASPQDTARIDKFADERLADYRTSNGNIRVFAIKEDGKIIAGGQIDIEGEGETKRAYLGQKFVSPEKRGQRLAAELVKKRLEVAKDAECKQAYSLVRKDNFPALRSITKDGFDISSTAQQEGLGHLRESYFVFQDLTTETPPSKIELSRVQKAIGNTEMKGNELVVPLSDKKTIEEALRAGFTGKYIFDANELSGLTEKAMYLEKQIAEPDSEA